MSAAQDHEQMEVPGAGMYALSRGEMASTRLNVQHYLFKDILGFNIHPNLLAGDKRAVLRVADVGTGTGIWTVDVRRHHPYMQIDGFDVSTSQYPPADWLPDAISLNRLDIFEPVPAQWVGRYDIVNVRLFMLVISAGNPREVLKNLITMLRPGGYLQWIEHDPHDAKIIPANPGLKSSSSEATLGRIQSFRDFNWISNLESILQEMGFVDVSAKSYLVPHELQMYWQQVVLLAAEDVTYVAMDNSGSNAEGPKFRQLIHEAITEMKSGCSMTWNPIVFLGRRTE